MWNRTTILLFGGLCSSIELWRQKLNRNQSNIAWRGVKRSFDFDFIKRVFNFLC